MKATIDLSPEEIEVLRKFVREARTDFRCTISWYVYRLGLLKVYDRYHTLRYQLWEWNFKRRNPFLWQRFCWSFILHRFSLPEIYYRHLL